ncbi:MAG TPA: universal stress protein, partial [Planctomycetota bacterium]|nr:universal stress protein [Planctomycetota bacterium]
RIDLVLLSGRGLGGALTGPLGSVAERVLETCPVPVLLLRGTGRIRRVLVALDEAPESLRVMAMVGETARPLHAKVALLQRGGRKEPALARAVDVLARLGIPSRIYLRSRRSPGTIEEVAGEVGADLVALSTVPAGEALGGEVEELLRHSERPLLLVRRAV